MGGGGPGPGDGGGGGGVGGHGGPARREYTTQSAFWTVWSQPSRWDTQRLAVVAPPAALQPDRTLNPMHRASAEQLPAP